MASNFFNFHFIFFFSAAKTDLEQLILVLPHPERQEHGWITPCWIYMVLRSEGSSTLGKQSINCEQPQDLQLPSCTMMISDNCVVLHWQLIILHLLHARGVKDDTWILFLFSGQFLWKCILINKYFCGQRSEGGVRLTLSHKSILYFKDDLLPFLFWSHTEES